MSYNSISYCIVPATQARRHAAAVGREACASVRRAGSHERRNALRLLRPTPCLAERRGPRGKRGDGQQKIGGVRRIARACRGALRGDEAGIAAFPSLELTREEGAARAVVGQARQMRVDAGDETARAICAAACGPRGGDLVLLSCSHPVFRPLQCAVGR